MSRHTLSLFSGTLALVLACSAFSCGDRAAAPPCAFGGQTYQSGDTFPAGDGCNTCRCTTEPSAGVQCTAQKCGESAGSGCTYDGKQYSRGAKFPATDGCNTCQCDSDGVVMCTAVGCPKKQDGGFEPTCPKVSYSSSAGTELGGKSCAVEDQVCSYLIEECVDYSDVEWQCTCKAGVWDCFRGYDCPRHYDLGGAPSYRKCELSESEGSVCSASFTACTTTKGYPSQFGLCSCNQGKVSCQWDTPKEGGSCQVEGASSGPTVCSCPSSPYCDCGCVCTAGSWKCTVNSRDIGVPNPIRDAGGGCC